MNPATRRAAFAFIFVTVLLDMLALGVTVPILPKLFLGFLGNDMARAAEFYGLSTTLWALMQFIFAPVQGSLSDRFGRRPVILASNFGLGSDYILMALAPSVGWLFLGRAISGITAASFSTAGAYIADVTAPEQRAARYGMLGAAFGIGFVLGPAVGGLLSGYDPRLPFWVAAALSLANGLYGLLVLPESLPQEKRAGFSWGKANPVGALVMLWTHPGLLGLAGIAFLHHLAHDVNPATFVLYTSHRYAWTGTTIGLCLAAVGVASMVVQGGLVKVIVQRIGERRTLLLGTFCGAAGFIVQGWAPAGGWFFAGIPLVALWGASMPALQGLATRRVDASEQGRLQGALSSLMGVALLIGPSLFTQVFAQSIEPERGWSLPGAPYLLAGVLLLAACALAARVTARRAEGERRAPQRLPNAEIPS